VDLREPSPRVCPAHQGVSRQARRRTHRRVRGGRQVARCPALAVPVTDDLITPAVSKALESAFTKFTQSLGGIVNASLKAFAHAQGQAKKHSVPLIFGEGNTSDPKKSFGDFCLAVARKDSGYLEKHYGSTLIPYQAKAALAEASGITGGYTVPPDFYKQRLAIVEEKAIFRSRAFVQPMASATLQFPYLDITTVQAAGTSPGRPASAVSR
jgi:HK97 family phage major capsid protein